MQILGPRCQMGGGLDGTRGWPTDPERYNEQDLLAKEIDQGPETFELQFMLNTALSDAARQQLKLRDLILADYSHEQVPESAFWSAEPRFRVELPADFCVQQAEMYRPAGQTDHFVPLKAMTLYLDPAGDGGDEIAFAVGGHVGPYIHIVGWGGWQGGVSDTNLDKLVDLCKRFGVKTVLIERNMGAGTVTKLVQNHFNGLDESGRKRIEGVGVDERSASGQKERRIIDTIRPVMQKHRLIIHRSALELDQELLQSYAQAHRDVRSGFHQMHNITTDRGSLAKDDRLDALEGLVRELTGFLVVDEDKEKAARAAARAAEFIKDPLGSSQHKQTQNTGRPKHKAWSRRFGR